MSERNMIAQSIISMCAWLCASAMIPIPFLSGFFFCAFVVRAYQFVFHVAASAKETIEKQKRPPTARHVVIVGNVGCGKSTAIRSAESSGEISDVAFLEEPVEAWSPLLKSASKSTASWLALQVTVACYYADPRSWNLSTSDSTWPRVVVTERSLESVALFSSKSTAMTKLLEMLCAFGTIRLPDAVVFITTPADVCFNRVTEGNRRQPGDKVIAERGVSYLQDLEAKHRTLCEWYKSHGVDVIYTPDAFSATGAIVDACIRASESSQDADPSALSPDMMTALISRLHEPNPAAAKRASSPRPRE